MIFPMPAFFRHALTQIGVKLLSATNNRQRLIAQTYMARIGVLRHGNTYNNVGAATFRTSALFL